MITNYLRQAGILAILTAAVSAAPAAAFTVDGWLQQTRAQFDAPHVTSIALDQDMEFTPAGGVFVNSLSSYITGSAPVVFYEADVNMAPSGIFGMAGSLLGGFDPGDPSRRAYLETSVRISNRVTNTHATPISVDFSFIINGGVFDLVADGASTLRYRLSVGDFAVAPLFESIGVLTGSDGSFLPTFASSGDSIGAVQTTPGGPVDVPLSFHTVSFANIQPGADIIITYDLSVALDVNVAEVVTWAFRDPSTISGTVPPTQVTIGQTPSTVPIPPGAALLTSGLLGLALVRRRRSLNR